VPPLGGQGLELGFSARGKGYLGPGGEGGFPLPPPSPPSFTGPARKSCSGVGVGWGGEGGRGLPSAWGRVDSCLRSGAPVTFLLHQTPIVWGTSLSGPGCERAILPGLGELSPTRGWERVNNRSVMPLDAFGCTRATLGGGTGLPAPNGGGEPWETPPCLGSLGVKTLCKQGISSNRRSQACGDFVPALCTHRPSLLPIGLPGELHGGRVLGDLTHFGRGPAS
jgi:hypothetical protein